MAAVKDTRIVRRRREKKVAIIDLLATPQVKKNYKTIKFIFQEALRTRNSVATVHLYLYKYLEPCGLSIIN